ncbi:PREDICTED: protein CHROMATIN REMODELING 4-like [Nelumbo nucifera]|uniref:Protein CHROMATIN REMODELING 4-like n=1 Tax=Nelumbo nucifera TaxID=4432 RepID=A0A1U8AMT3_NELNU|nr:PREDICTED: protein CHROMATIN REMODELING 4-like [Nelumbo nucifera]XP_010264053.1 PREDICTED: protein CHROMATIN REMODELING 4-like [Nelumbo nucifera]
MVNSKVVKTYVRKRTLSRTVPTHGIQCSSSTSNFQNDNFSGGINQHVESSKKHLPENEKGDAELCTKSSDDGGNLLHCGICLRHYHLQCNEPPTEHIAHKKWLCSACAKQENSGKILQHEVLVSGKKRERKCIKGSGERPIILHSHKVLPKRNAGEDASVKKTSGSLLKDTSAGSTFNYIDKSSCSSMFSGSVHKTAYTKVSSDTNVVDMETEIKITSVCVDSMLEKNCSLGCPSVSMLKVVDLESKNFCSNNKPLLCNGELHKEKYSSPLITFSRRAKKKGAVNSIDAPMQSMIEGKTFSENRWCNSTLDISCYYEGSSQKCGLVDWQKALIPSRESPKISHLTPSRGDEGVSSTMHPKIPSDTQEDQPIKCTKTSSKETVVMVRKRKQFDLPKITNTGDKTQIILNDGVNGTVKPVVGLLGDRDTMGQMDPPVSLPGSHDMIGPSCCKTNESASGSSLEFPNCSNNAIYLHKKVTHKGKCLKFLELVDKTVEKRQSSNQTLVGKCTCINRDESGSSYKGYRTTSTLLPIDISSQDHYQQADIDSFPEDNINEMTPVVCIPPEPTDCADFKGKIFPTQSGKDDNQCKQILTKSFLCHPHFLGLSLQSEPATAVDVSEGCSSVSSFPNFILKQRGSIQNLLPQPGSDQSRHKLMLDSSVARGRALKGSMACSSDKLQGYKTAWSEEELDFLWIGVRRHGRDNWEAMLRDSGLHFSTWRVAKNLEEKWDEEQSKLLNGALFQPLRLASQQVTPGTDSGLWTKETLEGNGHGNFYTNSHRIEIPDVLLDETQLSLGDVYSQRDRNIPKRILSNFPISTPSHQSLAEHNCLDRVSSVRSSSRNFLPKIGTKQVKKHSQCQRNQSSSDRKCATYGSDQFPILQQKPIDRTANYGLQNAELLDHGEESKGTSNYSPSSDFPPSGFPPKVSLPHWLKEAVNIPPRPIESPLTSAIPPTKQLSSFLYNDQQQAVLPFSSPDALPFQPKDSQGLKMNRINNKFIGLREPETLPPIACSFLGTRFSHHSSMSSNSLMSEFENQNLNIGADKLNLTCSHLVKTKPDDLVLNDNDASSEETISDDQNGRPQ